MDNDEQDSIASSRASSAPTETPGPVSQQIGSIPSTRSRSPEATASREEPRDKEQEKANEPLSPQRSAQPPLRYSGQFPDAKTLKALYDASVSAQARVPSTKAQEKHKESVVASMSQSQEEDLVEEEPELPGLNSGTARAQDEQEQSEAEMDIESSRASESRKYSRIT